MTAKEIFGLMSENPVFYLATQDGDQPRVRGMLLFRADENGIIFHTGSNKDVFAQIMKNPKAEMCFSANGIQIRTTGVLEENFDEKLKEEIFAHPSRQFMNTPAWKEICPYEMVRVFIMKNCSAVTWTMETNFAEKVVIPLC